MGTFGIKMIVTRGKAQHSVVFQLTEDILQYGGHIFFGGMNFDMRHGKTPFHDEIIIIISLKRRQENSIM